LTRIGWVGAFPASLKRAEFVVTAYDGGDVGVFARADEDVWVVDLAGAEKIARAAITSDRPVLLRVREDEPTGWWWNELARGHVDIIATSAAPHELFARIEGLLRRSRAWTAACSQFATTAAHDLRSPLQGLKFTLNLLSSGSQTQDDNAENMQLLAEIADAIELQLDGIYNQGRRLVSDRKEVFNLAGVIKAELSRPVFARVEHDVADVMSVSGHPGDLRQAVLDMLRVAVQVRPSKGRIILRARKEEREGIVWVEGSVFPVVSQHANALLRREGAMNLRPGVKLPLGGLAFAADVARACGGVLEVSAPDADHVLALLRIPLAD
jgi:signal transduction histidine kinase